MLIVHIKTWSQIQIHSLPNKSKLRLSNTRNPTTPLIIRPLNLIHQPLNLTRLVHKSLKHLHKSPASDLITLAIECRQVDEPMLHTGRPPDAHILAIAPRDCDLVEQGHPVVVDGFHFGVVAGF